MSTARLRIQAVAEAADVPTPTLRAWERRYGVPNPTRSEGGYRLYTDADVALVREMKSLIDAGLPASEAARVAREARSRQVTETDTPDPNRDVWDAAQARILDAVERFDPGGLETAVRWGLGLGSAPSVFREVIAPTMHEVGERWHAGVFSVAQEHLATAVLDRNARLLAELAQPEPPAPVALLACLEGEAHAVALFGVSLTLSRLGMRSVILGALVPPDALGHAVRTLRPELVGLSATMEPPKARSLMKAYGKACEDTPWLVGGAAAKTLEKDVRAAGGVPVLEGADGYAELVTQLVPGAHA